MGDNSDNCPNTYNPDQVDTDNDGIGDACDGDNDGILDSWEIANFGNLTTANDTTDYDNDGLLDIDEYANNTDPKNTDSDADGMPDGWEVTYGLDPLVDDSNGDIDGDGITNLQEYLDGTYPNIPALTISAITPSFGKKDTSVNVTNIAGSGFVDGTTTVRLTKTGSPNINATNVTVVSLTQITCNFNLAGAKAGKWNVVVTNPGGQSATLPYSFIVAITYLDEFIIAFGPGFGIWVMYNDRSWKKLPS